MWISRVRVGEASHPGPPRLVVVPPRPARVTFLKTMVLRWGLL